MQIVAFSGSTRKGSYNTALVRTLAELAPADMGITISDLAPLPFYNEDIESPLPASVRAFKDIIESADAVVIATPEYNRSIPGLLKNALDWASRPHGDNALRDARDDPPVRRRQARSKRGDGAHPGPPPGASA